MSDTIDQTDTTDTDDQTQIITYIGRRMQSGKVQHCFLEDGLTIWWPKARKSLFRGCQIGTTYKLGERFPGLWHDCAIDGDAANQHSDQDKLNWQVADRAAAQKDAELKKSPSPDLDALITRLRDARRCVAASRRPAFDAWLLNQLR